VLSRRQPLHLAALAGGHARPQQLILLVARGPMRDTGSPTCARARRAICRRFVSSLPTVSAISL